jgi:ATP-dependent DNA helicase RecQ
VDRGLFESLRTLRTKLANERGVPPYVVFGDAALRDMARRRPSSLDGFLDVRGVGEQKRADYGEAFVEAIVTYCRTNGVAMDVDAGPVGGKPSRAPRPDASGPNGSAAMAFVHFRRGASIEEVMQLMGRARSTVCGYLLQYLQFERLMDPAPWLDQAIFTKVEAAIEIVGAAGLKPIFEHLKREVSYEEIRIAAACLANRNDA